MGLRETPKTIPGFDGTDIAVVDSAVTHGIIVCGMGQAGKTTARDLLCATWHDFDPQAEVLPFTNSNGFRGLTYKVIEHFGLPDDVVVNEEVYATLLDQYVAQADMSSLLDSLYEQPLPEAQLRNLAVNSVVSITAETPHVRPLVNMAGARSLADMIEHPLKYGHQEAPGLVALDVRNNQEGQLKFRQACVRNLGTIVLTCPEEVVVQRQPQPLELLKRRNVKDRHNPIGPMTLPEDFRTTYVVDELLQAAHAQQLLHEAGATVATDEDAAIVMRTDRLTINEEAIAMDAIVHGMLVPGNV